MKKAILYLFVIFFNSLLGQTYCALVSYPDFSNYHTPQAYIDENLKVLYQESKDQSLSERIFEYKDGLGRIRRNGKFGFIDHKGNMIIPAMFEGAMDFNEGLAEVKVDYKWGYINTKGKIVIEPKYKISHKFSCGLAAFDDDKNGKHGFIDQEGKVIIPAIYDRVTHFRENKAWVLVKGKWGCIDKKGKFIIEPQYEDTYDFSEGYSWVRNTKAWALIDTTNKIIIPFREDNHLVYSESGAKKTLAQVVYGMIVTKENGKTGFSSLPDLKKIIPSEFDEVRPFEDSLATACVNGKWGVIRTNGTFYLEPKFEKLKYIGSKKMFAIEQNKNFRIFYKDSEKVSSEEFQNVHNFEMIR